VAQTVNLKIDLRSGEKADLVGLDHRLVFGILGEKRK